MRTLVRSRSSRAQALSRGPSCLSVDQDWGALIGLWLKDKRMQREEEGRAGGKRREEQGEQEQTYVRLRREVVKPLGKGEISKAYNLLKSDGVASLDDESVQEKVLAKYPERKKELPSHVPKSAPLENLKGLQDALLSLRRGVSPGTGCLRTEYLKALAEVPCSS